MEAEIQQICAIYADAGLMSISASYDFYNPYQSCFLSSRQAAWQEKLHEVYSKYFDMGVSKKGVTAKMIASLTDPAYRLIENLQHPVHVAHMFLYLMCEQCLSDQGFIDNPNDKQKPIDTYVENTGIDAVITALLIREDVQLPDHVVVDSIFDGHHFTDNARVGAKVVYALCILCSIFTPLFFVDVDVDEDIVNSIHEFGIRPDIRDETSAHVLFSNHQPEIKSGLHMFDNIDDMSLEHHLTKTAVANACVDILVHQNTDVIQAFYSHCVADGSSHKETNMSLLFTQIVGVTDMDIDDNPLGKQINIILDTFGDFFTRLPAQVQSVLENTSERLAIATLFIAIIRQTVTCLQTGTPICMHTADNKYPLCPGLMDQYMPARFRCIDRTRFLSEIDALVRKTREFVQHLSGGGLVKWCVMQMLTKTSVSFCIPRGVDAYCAKYIPHVEVRHAAKVFTYYIYEAELTIPRWHTSDMNDSKDDFKLSILPFMKYLHQIDVLTRDQVEGAEQFIFLSIKDYNRYRAEKSGWTLAS